MDIIKQSVYKLAALHSAVKPLPGQYIQMVTLVGMVSKKQEFATPICSMIRSSAAIRSASQFFSFGFIQFQANLFFIQYGLQQAFGKLPFFLAEYLYKICIGWFCVKN